MKKVLIFIVLFGSLLFGMTGCNSEKEVEVTTLDELNDINDKITIYFSSDDNQYDNLCFNYVDEVNMVVVVGLLDNSKEEQEKFKDTIVNSEFIEFIQGSKNINLPTY